MKGREQFIAHNGGTKGPLAIRVGTWKYIQPGGNSYGGPAKAAGQQATPAGMLFDLSSDLAEQKNLAAEQPERVKEMRALIDKAREAGRTR
jgi:hypothetical protein